MLGGYGHILDRVTVGAAWLGEDQALLGSAISSCRDLRPPGRRVISATLADGHALQARFTNN